MAAHLPESSTVEELFRRARDGDETAFSAFYLLSRRPLMAYCLAITGNADDAEEAFQTTMLKIWEHRRKFRDTNLMGWMFTIARNHSRNLQRSARRHQHAEDFELDLRAMHVGLADDERRLIYQTVLTLPEDYREVILLRYFGEMSLDDIALAHGTNSNTIKQRLFRARRHLAEMLGTYFEEWT